MKTTKMNRRTTHANLVLLALAWVVASACAADVAPEAAPNDTIAIGPGSFKPPHMGHLKMVEEYANSNNTDILEQNIYRIFCLG